MLVGLAMGLFIFGIAQMANANVVLSSDFNDGTLQGWTEEPYFGGNLFVDLTGGNPGGFMVTTDTVGGGGGLLARAPGVMGDISNFESIQWDEYIYNNGSSTNRSTSVLLIGTDGTSYASSNELEAIAEWNTKYVQFDDSTNWTLKSGTATFEDLIVNLDGLFFQMEVSTQASGREAGIDNILINAVPIPGAVWLLGSGLSVLVAARRKKCN